MCTIFHNTAANNAVIVGRAMDFGMQLDPVFYVQQRGTELLQTSYDLTDYDDQVELSNLPGKYGFVGVSVSNLILPFTDRIVVDGINEVGLNASILFIENTEFQKPKDFKTTIFAPLMCNWALSQCGNIREAKEKLLEHRFWFPKKLTSVLPMYMALVDKNGDSIVVQFKDGEMKIHNNAVGVSTNGPWYPWHLENLSNYAHLSENTPEPYNINSLQLDTKDGSGLLGIPGDFTSVSRFIRVTYEKYLMGQPLNNEAAYEQATHLLNSVDFGRGVKRGGSQDLNKYIYTRWSTIKDLDKKVLAIRTHKNMQYHAVDLSVIDFENISSYFIDIPESPIFNFL